MFEQLRLSSVAERIYRELLTSRGTDVGLLADRLGITEHVVRLSIAELSALGLATLDKESDIPRAAGLDVAQMLLAERLRAELERQFQQNEKNQFEMAALIAEVASADSALGDPQIRLIQGCHNVRSRIQQILAQCMFRMDLFIPSQIFGEVSLGFLATFLDRVDQNGFRARFVYQDSVRNQSRELEQPLSIDGVVAAGADVRATSVLPCGLLIADRKAALIFGASTLPGESAVEITNNQVMLVLTTLFNLVWRSASPWRAPRLRSAQGLSSQEQQIVKSLAQGLTDAAIARQLGVSVRTVRRELAFIYGRLGVSSRFQAGANAALRGWVTKDDLDE